jgi:bacteriorhodopsin
VLLVVDWIVYPIVYGIQGVAEGGAWLVTAQLALSGADLVAKTGVVTLLYAVARRRTAADAAPAGGPLPQVIRVEDVKRSRAAGGGRGLRRRGRR